MWLSRAICSALVFLSAVMSYAYGQTEKTPLWNETWTDRLRQDLFVKYDKFARPAQHYNATEVDFGIRIHNINVDEFKSTVTVGAWARQVWKDEKLKWDPAKYGNVTELHVANHEIWKPDIALFSSGAGSNIEHYGNTRYVISSNGEVVWVPPAEFITLCELDFRLWPFDTQNCTMTFGSWTHHGEQIDLQIHDANGTDDIYVKDIAWELVDVIVKRESTVYSCCEETYPSLKFHMILKRNSNIYSSIFLMPAAAIVFLILVIFWLSPQSEMKISISACNVLIIVVMLIYIGSKVPSTANSPLIVHFYSGCLCLVIISLVLSAFVINISKRTYYKPLPWKIRMFLLSWPVEKLLGLSDHINMIESRRSMPSEELRSKLMDETATNSMSSTSNYGDRQDIISSAMQNATHLEWILAATVVDRIAFVLFSLILATMAIAYIS